MGLAAVLVDRARTIRKEAGARVEGRSANVTVEGAWFKARLMLDTAEAQESVDTGRGRRATVPRPQLLYGVGDLEGGTVDVFASDQIEVFSVELGSAIWRVTGDPQPIRKKRRVIGWQAGLERLHEPERQAA